MTPNLAGFLQMISVSEGTAGLPDPYRACFGYTHTIKDLSNHPAITGEWKGEHFTLNGVNDLSTAAGKYQIIKPTWESIQVILRLPDFTAPSQDDAAIFLIKQHGALDLVNSGQFAEAVNACRNVWASLPGGDSGQKQRKFVDLVRAYSDAGGGFA